MAAAQTEHQGLHSSALLSESKSLPESKWFFVPSPDILHSQSGQKSKILKVGNFWLESGILKESWCCNNSISSLFEKAVEKQVSITDMDMSLGLFSRWHIHHFGYYVVLSAFFSKNASLLNKKFLSKSLENNSCYFFFFSYSYSYEIWDQGLPSWSLQLPEGGKWRGQCWSLLCGMQW